MKYQENINRFIQERQEHERRNLMKETSIRWAFHYFIREVIKQDSQYKQYKVTIEDSDKTRQGKQVYYDATINNNGIRFGVIENKDPSDDLAKELANKTGRHYDLSNAILENGHEAWLITNGEVSQKVVYFASAHPQNKKYYQASVNLAAFSELISTFLANTSEEEQRYYKALTKFEEMVPYWASMVNQRIDNELTGNSGFKQQLFSYYEELKVAISEYLSIEDVKEVLIQHILTIDLFEEIVGSSDFRRKNAVAKIMDALGDALDPAMARNISKDVRSAYKPLNKSIANLGDALSYKVDVLKSFYQTFYHAYNTDDKDKLGIIYTPTEIINFMVNASHMLLKEYFGKPIFDKDVHILDPCTRTGSFIVMLMQYIVNNGNKNALPHKFANELFANELSILAYYIANIHIELMYEELTGDFAYFTNLVYADTLANKYAIQQSDDGRDIVSTIFDENTKQLEEQNSKKIQLIIGNPPYRANQRRGNENKQNNIYSYVDQRIDETYIANNNKKVATKLKIKDMYTRFIRWASDRVGDEGMLAVVTNRNYLDAAGFNGFRASVAQEFSHIYVIDLGGDVRKNSKLNGPRNNVFGIQTGVAIAFFIKTNKKPASEGIYYLDPFAPEELASRKLEWLAFRREDNIVKSLDWQLISPNAKSYWLEQSDAFDRLIALGDKYTKNSDDTPALFYLYSLGVVTARDSWMYDINDQRLATKVQYFIDECHKFIPQAKLDATHFPTTIQANRKLIGALTKVDFNLVYNHKNLVSSLYRPFTKRFFYYQNTVNEALGKMPSIFPNGQPNENLLICVGVGTGKPFSTLITNFVPCYDFCSPANGGSQCFPLYRYTADGEKISNINPTYKARFEAQGTLTDEEMFAYVYAMLHHPLYRSTYEVDLKQNLPSLPVSPAVPAYVELGQRLMQLHLHYETIDPYPIQRVESDPKLYAVKLKSNAVAGTIVIDTQTTLSGIPPQAWHYKLGNKSAIDWVLEGYTDKKNSTTDKASGAIADPASNLYQEYGYTVYNFAHYKEQAIELVARVVSVSLQTQEIVGAIAQLPLE